jgi:Alkylmercury lyase
MNESDVLTRVRAFIFDDFMQRNHAPTASETAQALKLDGAAVRDAYRALAEGHVIVLQSSGEILTANPYAAVPTPFVVETARGAYNGICIWDALGIVANLGCDATVRTTCGDCSDGISLTVRAGNLVQAGGELVHISVPARHWWTNIVFS